MLLCSANSRSRNCLQLDADGGGTIDEEEFVDGLLERPAVLERFNQVNPVIECRVVPCGG